MKDTDIIAELHTFGSGWTQTGLWSQRKRRAEQVAALHKEQQRAANDACEQEVKMLKTFKRKVLRATFSRRGADVMGRIRLMIKSVEDEQERAVTRFRSGRV